MSNKVQSHVHSSNSKYKGTHAILIKCPHHKDGVEVNQLLTIKEGHHVVKKPAPSTKYLNKHFNEDKEKIAQVESLHEHNSSSFCRYA